MEVGSKREQIEKEGFQADKILIKGSQTGKLLVNVEIVEENLKNQSNNSWKESSDHWPDLHGSDDG